MKQHILEYLGMVLLVAILFCYVQMCVCVNHHNHRGTLDWLGWYTAFALPFMGITFYLQWEDMNTRHSREYKAMIERHHKEWQELLKWHQEVREQSEQN